YLMFQNCGGADPFIVQRSDKFGITIISIYVGEGPAEILFEATGWGASKITVSSTERDQSEKPMIVVKPHWFQKPIFSGISSWVAKNILKI
ncbi:MAG: hypothetical protein WAX66_00875, partial [Patescibacteria group bacterium]